jgi:hypothetical protein
MKHNDLGSTLEAMESSGQSEARDLAEFIRGALLAEKAGGTLIMASMDEFIGWARQVKAAVNDNPRKKP